MRKSLIIVIVILSGFYPVSCQNNQKTNTQNKPQVMDSKIVKTEDEWKKQLSDEQYYVLREKGTERPFTGKYNMHFEKGIYTCAGCGFELFNDDQKFDSHCGWPSFDSEIGDGSRIKKIKDNSHGMIRTEIVCANCGGHLGHVFDDGSTKTGIRYCVNSLSLDFKPVSETK
jgi:peptide-methionine (R)-S-oxide reductase